MLTMVFLVLMVTYVQMSSTYLLIGLLACVMGGVLAVEQCTLRFLGIPTTDVQRILLLWLNVMGMLLLTWFQRKLREDSSIWLAIIMAEKIPEIGKRQRFAI